MKPSPPDCTSVLLVDDDPQIVRALVPALQVCGIQVTVATCGREAIEHSTLRHWHAAVVDLGLPDMDGKGVVRHFTHEYGTPVIVISAQHSASETNAATQAGALHFLHKPFATPELIERLRLVLGRGRRLSQA